MARDVAGCAAMMQALAPGFAVEEAELAGLAAGIGWLEQADPLVRRRVEEAAARIPAVRPVDLPEPGGTFPVFMREVADVHRELYEEQGDLYGENVRLKIERCLAITDAEVAAAVSLRAGYERRMLAVFEGLDLLLTPTLGFVAPAADIDEIATRERFVHFTYPFNLLGWPALALPCGAAEDGLPASIQVIGRPGADALVLGAGLALEAALAR